MLCGVRCEQEKMCLTVRGVSVPQRLHDRGKRRERRIKVNSDIVILFPPNLRSRVRISSFGILLNMLLSLIHI